MYGGSDVYVSGHTYTSLSFDIGIRDVPRYCVRMHGHRCIKGFMQFDRSFLVVSVHLQSNLFPLPPFLF